MNLNGSLDAFGLPDVLALLAMTGKSGVLRLHHDPPGRDVRVDGAIWFHDGRVTAASADCSRQLLVRRLVGSGAVDDAALSAAVERAASSPVGVARALLEAGAVEADLVREAAVDQAVDAVFELSRWDSGEFGFDPGGRDGDDVGVALDHTWLVAEAQARRAAWDELREVVPGSDGVLTLTVVLEQDPQVSREEWSLLALVDGQRSVEDLVRLTGCGEFAVLTVVAGLVRRGLLAVPAQGQAHVATVERRLALLTAAETVPSAGTPQPDEPAQLDETALEAPPDVAPEAGQDAAPEPGAATLASVPAGGMSAAQALAAARAVQGASAERREVVPPRPEPFLPQRRIAHPEPTVAAGTSAGQAGAGPVAAAVPAPAAAPAPVRAAATVVAGHLTPTAGNTAMVASHPMSAPSASPTPVGQGIIERDPAVNRSLLLRLIAGVRGL